MAGSETLKSPPLNTRIKGPQRALIERAARQADKSISDFVRDAAIQEAQNTLLDKTRFELAPAAWEQLIALVVGSVARAEAQGRCDATCRTRCRSCCLRA